MKEASPRTIKLEDYQPPALSYRYGRSRVRSAGAGYSGDREAWRSGAIPKGEGGPLRLHGEGLQPVWVRLDGRELSADHYRVDEESLTLLDPPEAFVLESEVIIAPEDNTALEGLYRSGGMFCTQCEPEGFRKITWFIDRPDVMARFTVRVEADKSAIRCCCRTAIRVSRVICRRPSLCGLGRPDPQAQLPVCPGRRRSALCRGPAYDALRARGAAARLCRAGKHRSL